LERKKIEIEEVRLRMTRLRLRRGYLTRKREDRLCHLKRRGRRSWCRGERLVRRRFPVGSFGRFWFHPRLGLRSCHSRIEDDLCRVLLRFLRQEEVLVERIFHWCMFVLIRKQECKIGLVRI